MISLRKYTVFPGQFVITSVPALISTVLGSCVSVCLWDSESHIGGLNHYLLPGNESDESGNANRGLTATTMLVHSMLNRNVKLENLEAKVFGGCNSLYRNNDIFKVGERNITMALDSNRSSSTAFKIAAWGRVPLQLPMIRAALAATRSSD